MGEITVGKNKNVLNPNSLSFEEREAQLAKEAELEDFKNKREKNSPFSNFYQFNRDHTKEVIWLATHQPKAQVVLLFLLDQMDNYNAVVCSYQVLQEALGMSRATVARAVKTLKERGFITVYKSGGTNVYAVNKNLAWSSWGKNYKYAKFDAKIIISESEQEKLDIKVGSERQKIITVTPKESA